MRKPLTALLVLGACATEEGPALISSDAGYLGPALLRVETRMSRNTSRAELEAHARCAAMGRALADGFDYARHVRTKTSIEAGIRRADAVYTVAAVLPPGLQVLDTNEIGAECVNLGIPLS